MPSLCREIGRPYFPTLTAAKLTERDSRRILGPFRLFLFSDGGYRSGINNRLSKLRQIELFAFEMRFQSPRNWHT